MFRNLLWCVPCASNLYNVPEEMCGVPIKIQLRQTVKHLSKFQPRLVFAITNHQKTKKTQNKEDLKKKSLRT